MGCTQAVCQVYPRGPARPSHGAGWIELHRVKVLNVAGNRASTAPDVGPRVERFLGEVLRRLGHERA
jgi:hypothetical protein